MSLFEPHKLLFAFYISIKLNEPSPVSSSDFSAKLKQLDLLMKKGKQKSFLTSQKRESVKDSAGIKPRKMSVKVDSRAGSRVSYSSGDNILQAQANLMAIQREEDRVKIDPELLKYVLTGLLPKELQPYSDLENPSSLISIEIWA